MCCQNGINWSVILRKFRCYGTLVIWFLLGLWIIMNLILANKKGSANFLTAVNDLEGKILSRNKRFIYMDNSRRLCLPTGAILAFSGVASLPFLGNLPLGYGSGLTIAVPLTIKFDDLGLTSEDNRFGYIDFLNMTGYMGLPALNLSALRLPSFLHPHQFSDNLVTNLENLFVKRQKRSQWKNFPGVNYAGGDRKMVYQVVEDFISSFGFDGQACVVRAICEMHEEPLFNYGFFGEVLELLLSPGLAAFAEYRLGPYLQAEKQGKEKKECSKYHSMCEYSLFSPKSLYEREHHGNNSIHFEDETYNMILNETSLSNVPHHRQKRFFMFGPHRRVVFPPSTVLVGTPTLNLPFLRDLPKGFSSQLSYSIPFSLNFDALGLSSILNTFGNIPFLKKKKKREAYNTMDRINYAAGDREMMFAVVADALSNIGMDGEACLLRVICEIHEMPLVNHGLFGDILQLFLSPSLSPGAKERLMKFVKAEQLGKNCGDCSIYNDRCPKSLFTNPGAGIKYSNKMELEECKKRHAYEYREENMNFVQTFKSKYRTVKKKAEPSSKFVKEIANKISVKRLFEKL